jgi:acetyl esterase/lipase
MRTKTISEYILTPVNKIMSGKGRIDNIEYGFTNAYMRYDEFPSTDPNAPLLIFWYGGSWKTGNKQMYRFVGSKFQSLGAHSFVIDYPKYPDQTFPGFLDDAAMAVKHIKDRYPGRKVILAGHSAGANTALLVAYMKLAEVDKVISLAGVCNLAEKYWFPVFGESLKNKQHDPRTFAPGSPDNLSSLLIHGVIDSTVLVHDSLTLNRILKKNGKKSELLLVKFVGHFLIVPALMFGPMFVTRRRLKSFIHS